MAKLTFNTECPCGAELKSSVKKPTRFENSFQKLHCKKCGSRFLLTCVRDKEIGKRTFTAHFEDLVLSPMAQRIQAARLPVKAKILAAHLGVLPEEKPSAIKTDLDES